MQEKESTMVENSVTSDDCSASHSASLVIPPQQFLSNDGIFDLQPLLNSKPKIIIKSNSPAYMTMRA